MANPADAPTLSRVLSLGQQEIDTILTRAPADIEAGMLRLATFAQAHLDSSPGPLTYRRALVALLTVAKNTMITAATHAHHHRLKGLVTAPLAPRVVYRFDQPRSEKPGPAPPTLLGALPKRRQGLVEQPRPSWRAYAHEQLLARLNRVVFMAGPDEPADAPVPVAAPAQDIEPKPLTPALQRVYDKMNGGAQFIATNAAERKSCERLVKRHVVKRHPDIGFCQS